MNCKLPDVQAGFRKGRGTRDQIANICWIMEKAREFQKNIYFCFIDYAKAFDCVDHNKLWKILKEMGIPDYLTCLLRNLYAGQKATVRTGYGTTRKKESESEVAQSCPNLYDPMDARLLCPWDFLGKSTGVACHCLLRLAYTFLKRQIRCSGIPISFRIFQSFLGSTKSNALA